MATSLEAGMDGAEILSGAFWVGKICFDVLAIGR
jgi:hypothetical protein